MNKTKFMQTDSRWGGLVYPKKPCYIRNVGCGEVGIANMIIEMEQYAQYTPATIQPYCKQFGAPNCAGTYFSGIPTMMKHYGMTEVKEHATMDALWKELAKGDRVAIYLMGSRKGGSKGVAWTSGGHFVVSVGYRYHNGDHEVYMKDSYSNSSLRNGWIGYKTHLKGDVVRVWSGKLNGAKTAEQTTTKSNKLAVDGVGGTNTIKAMQKFFGTTQDGYIGDQMQKLAQYYPSITAVKFGNGKSGSQTVKALQKWLGLTRDGIIGKGTTAAWQKKLRDLGYLAKNETIDGIFGVKSMKAWQKFLNDKLFKEETTPTTPTEPTKPTTDFKVIDISNFQGTIDFAKVKADGIKGVIAKCGYRGAEDGKLKEDSRFLEHIRNAYKAGLPVGIYMFTQAITADEGKAEADYAVSMWKKADVPISFPITIDTENVFYDKNGKRYPGRANGLTTAKRTEAVKAFCDRIKELGYEPTIYASTSWLNGKLDMSKLPYKVWVAQYASKCEYKGEYVLWQYTSQGKINGIAERVDISHCYIEPKEVPCPKPKKTIDELANEVIEGKWGKGDERKQRLTEAGYDYDAVQKRINEIFAFLDKIMVACKDQAEWSKNSKYEWQSNPTIEKSKLKETCVTYAACVLQRVKLLASGKYIWHYKNGKVYGANDNFTIIYPQNKTLSQLKGELRKGDFIMDGDKTDLEKGSHIFILTGEWSGSYPIVWDNHSAQGRGGKSYKYTRNRPVIAIVRPKVG